MAEQRTNGLGQLVEKDENGRWVPVKGPKTPERTEVETAAVTPAEAEGEVEIDSQPQPEEVTEEPVDEDEPRKKWRK